MSIFLSLPLYCLPPGLKAAGLIHVCVYQTWPCYRAQVDDDDCNSIGEDSIHADGGEVRQAWQLDPTVLATYQPSGDSDASTSLEEQTLRHRKNSAVISFYQVLGLGKGNVLGSF